MLPPAASVAGSPAASTWKLLLEVLNCAICTANVPWFVMETFRYTGVPTLTSPKSTVAGLTTRACVLALVDENGLVSAPQPERPKVSAREEAPNAIAQVAFRRLLDVADLLFVWISCG
jgi:hypothetical protein